MLWTKYIGVLKGNYLYLFENKQSETYTHYVYMKDSNVELIDQAESGRPYSIRIHNTVSSELISFTKEESLKEWSRIIDTKKSLSFVEKKASESKVDNNKLKVQLLFSLKDIGIKLSNEKNEDWIDIFLSTFFLKMDIYECRKEITFSLKAMSISDTVETYLNPNHKYLINTGEKNEQFVNVKVVQKGEKDPSYKNIVNDVELSLGVIWVNLKPSVINELLTFFVPVAEEKKTPQLKHAVSTTSTEISTEDIPLKQPQGATRLFVRLKFEF